MNAKTAINAARKNGISLNAISQAIKIAAATRGIKITKRAFLSDVLGVGTTRTSTGRYWEGTYNILPWERRSDAERAGAAMCANEVLDAIASGSV